MIQDHMAFMQMNQYRNVLLGNTEDVYLSPEAFEQYQQKQIRPQYDLILNDVWALGLTILTAATFWNMSTIYQIVDNNPQSFDQGGQNDQGIDYSKLDEQVRNLKSRYSDTFYRVVYQMLQVDPNERVTLQGLRAMIDESIEGLQQGRGGKRGHGGENGQSDDPVYVRQNQSPQRQNQEGDDEEYSTLKQYHFDERENLLYSYMNDIEKMPVQQQMRVPARQSQDYQNPELYEDMDIPDEQDNSRSGQYRGGSQGPQQQQHQQSRPRPRQQQRSHPQRRQNPEQFEDMEIPDEKSEESYKNYKIQQKLDQTRTSCGRSQNIRNTVNPQSQYNRQSPTQSMDFNDMMMQSRGQSQGMPNRHYDDERPQQYDRRQDNRMSVINDTEYDDQYDTFGGYPQQNQGGDQKRKSVQFNLQPSYSNNRRSIMKRKQKRQQKQKEIEGMQILDFTDEVDDEPYDSRMDQQPEEPSRSYQQREQRRSPSTPTFSNPNHQSGRSPPQPFQRPQKQVQEVKRPPSPPPQPRVNEPQYDWQSEEKYAPRDQIGFREEERPRRQTQQPMITRSQPQQQPIQVQPTGKFGLPPQQQQQQPRQPQQFVTQSHQPNTNDHYRRQSQAQQQPIQVQPTGKFGLPPQQQQQPNRQPQQFVTQSHQPNTTSPYDHNTMPQPPQQVITQPIQPVRRQSPPPPPDPYKPEVIDYSFNPNASQPGMKVFMPKPVPRKPSQVDQGQLNTILSRYGFRDQQNGGQQVAPPVSYQRNDALSQRVQEALDKAQKYRQLHQ